jgi:outer membrane protein assembly factor BamB
MEPETSAAPTAPPASNLSEKPRRIRVWPGIVLAGAFWAFYFAIGVPELPITTTFMSRAGAGALFVLLISIWWLANWTIGLADRLWVFLALIIGATTAAVVSQKTLTVPGLLFAGLPPAFSILAVGPLVLRWLSPRHLRAGLILALSLMWIYFSLLRMDGLSGDLQANLRWRWSPRNEDAYVAERAREAETDADSADEVSSAIAAGPIEVGPGDWPVFRGPGQNGEVRGIEIPTDWDAAPPELVWRQKIGPAWSSMIVVGGRLFTQEQVGEVEAVVCLDAATGRRIWSHDDAVRFWDSQSGAGPRATPTFAAGAIYAQGATGILNCLDAVTGDVKWSRDIMKDSAAPLPMWGFSSTPLVRENLVIVFAGGADGKGLLAYRADDGEPAWTAATGPVSYTSAQPAELGGSSQVLLLSDAGLIGVETASGKVAWEYEAPGHGVWRAVQPAVLGPDTVLLGSEDLGTVSLEVRERDGAWSAKRRFASRAMKPGYNDFVVRDGCAYGFDGGIFCCIDVETGKRRWKGGRYGHGQVLLLADQGLLLVTSERGEAVLLEASPEAHRELGRFQAVEGKTWNHPAIADGRLYVRNDEQIACYRLRDEVETVEAP